MWHKKILLILSATLFYLSVPAYSVGIEQEVYLAKNPEIIRVIKILRLGKRTPEQILSYLQENKYLELITPEVAQREFGIEWAPTIPLMAFKAYAQISAEIIADKSGTMKPSAQAALEHLLRNAMVLPRLIIYRLAGTVNEYGLLTIDPIQPYQAIGEYTGNAKVVAGTKAGEKVKVSYASRPYTMYKGIDVGGRSFIDASTKGGAIRFARYFPNVTELWKRYTLKDIRRTEVAVANAYINHTIVDNHMHSFLCALLYIAPFEPIGYSFPPESEKCCPYATTEVRAHLFNHHGEIIPTEQYTVDKAVFLSPVSRHLIDIGIITLKDFLYLLKMTKTSDDRSKIYLSDGEIKIDITNSEGTVTVSLAEYIKSSLRSLSPIDGKINLKRHGVKKSYIYDISRPNWFGVGYKELFLALSQLQRRDTVYLNLDPAKDVGEASFVQAMPLKLQQLIWKLIVAEGNTPPVVPSLSMLATQGYYDDDMVNRLIDTYFPHLGPGITHAINIEANAGDTFYQNIRQREEQIKIYETATESRIARLFIPLNLGDHEVTIDPNLSSYTRVAGNHWAGLCIVRHYVQGSEQVLIRYFDPLGLPLPIILRNQLDRLYPNAQYWVNDTVYQHDGHNCGPWMIEFFRHMVNDTLLQTDFDIDGAREQHAIVLRLDGNDAQIPNLTNHSVMTIAAEAPSPSGSYSSSATFYSGE